MPYPFLRTYSLMNRIIERLGKENQKGVNSDWIIPSDKYIEKFKEQINIKKNANPKKPNLPKTFNPSDSAT